MRPLGFPAIYQEANDRDKMPKKTIKKWKKKARQKAKKHIRKESK